MSPYAFRSGSRRRNRERRDGRREYAPRTSREPQIAAVLVRPEHCSTTDACPFSANDVEVLVAAILATIAHDSATISAAITSQSTTAPTDAPHARDETSRRLALFHGRRVERHFRDPLTHWAVTTTPTDDHHRGGTRFIVAARMGVAVERPMPCHEETFSTNARRRSTGNDRPASAIIVSRLGTQSGVPEIRRSETPLAVRSRM